MITLEYLKSENPDLYDSMVQIVVEKLNVINYDQSIAKFMSYEDAVVLSPDWAICDVLAKFKVFMNGVILGRELQFNEIVKEDIEECANHKKLYDEGAEDRELTRQVFRQLREEPTELPTSKLLRRAWIKSLGGKDGSNEESK